MTDEKWERWLRYGPEPEDEVATGNQLWPESDPEATAAEKVCEALIPFWGGDDFADEPPGMEVYDVWLEWRRTKEG